MVTLKIDYPDKYRLWTEMVRGGVDRLFMATDERLAIGLPTEVQLSLPDLTLPIVVEGQVVGRRPGSRRFAAGVYLRFDEDEIDKCRHFLGLADSGSLIVRARRTSRSQQRFAVSFDEPQTDQSATGQDVSTGGMQVTTSLALFPGQRVRVSVSIDDSEPLRLQGEVRWVEAERSLVGLRFVRLGAEDRTRLERLLEPQEELRRAQKSKQPPSVVVADDDPDILGFIATALGNKGYDVHQTVKGYEALELIRKHKPRISLLDILMPGIDGSDICRILRADDELADLPVIFISALEEEDLRGVAEEAGATDYLAKPIKIEDLLEIVEAYNKVTRG